MNIIEEKGGSFEDIDNWLINFIILMEKKEFSMK